MTQVVVPYLGLLNIPIKTYTQTYVSVLGAWNFSSSEITPMEAGASNVGSVFKGVKGNIFTRNFITPFTVGDVSAGFNGGGTLSWFNNTLAVLGAIPNGTGQSEPWGQTFAMPLNGVGVNQPVLGMARLKVIPNLPNAATPSPNLGWGGRAAAPLQFTGSTVGVRYSYNDGTNNIHAVWDGTNNVQGTQDPGFRSTGPVLESCLPAGNGLNNCYTFVAGNSELASMWTQGYLLKPPVLQSALFLQPPNCSLNIDSYLHTDTNKSLSPTSLGFIQLNAGSITVGTTTLTGWGILVLPGFSGYYLLQITGTDTPSLNWTAGGSMGALWAAMGDDNDLFIKQNNNQTTLFISTAPVVIPTNPNIGVPRQRAWSFVLDGHTFYVLDLGLEGTFVYDITTEQWAQFTTQGFIQWDAGNGVMWGNRIVAGDLLSNQVWEVVASVTNDQGSLDIQHTVTGGLASRSRQYHSVDNVQLAISKGQYDDPTSTAVNLRFSDDGGQTWSPYFTVTLPDGQTLGSLQWSSLGAFSAPGRVFEFSDIGGPIRIDGADAFVDGFDDDNPVDTPPGKE